MLAVTTNEQALLADQAVKCDNHAYNASLLHSWVSFTRFSRVCSLNNVTLSGRNPSESLELANLEKTDHIASITHPVVIS